MKMNCEQCGDLEMAYLDGYAIGDTLLEGVEFEIRIKKGKVTALTALGCHDYMSDLNEKKWLKFWKKNEKGTEPMTVWLPRH
jgi:hypothetical protein